MERCHATCGIPRPHHALLWTRRRPVLSHVLTYSERRVRLLGRLPISPGSRTRPTSAAHFVRILPNGVEACKRNVCDATLQAAVGRRAAQAKTWFVLSVPASALDEVQITVDLPDRAARDKDHQRSTDSARVILPLSVLRGCNAFRGGAREGVAVFLERCVRNVRLGVVCVLMGSELRSGDRAPLALFPS
jgi:hypothetical protein